MVATEYSSSDAQTIQHLSRINCTGQEPRLMDCTHEGIGVNTCGMILNKDAAVACSGEHTIHPIILKTVSLTTTCLQDNILSATLQQPLTY